MKRLTFLFLFLPLIFYGFKTGKPAYLLFNENGKKVKYNKMLNQIKDADIILFGELHNNPVSHWLQLKLTKDLHLLNDSGLILGAEMFESDNQLILDEYFDGLISQMRFEAEARLWSNYKTDYKPLLEYARKNRLRFVATNVPRRYASLVNSEGFTALEQLSDEAKAFLPPLPVLYNPELSSYKEMMNMEGMQGHISENFPKAQAVKDAAMAHFILKNLSPGKQFVHFNGAYHSDNFEGIYWYLKQYEASLNIVTITTVLQENIRELEEDYTGRANFIICVDEDMTTTF